MKVFEEASTIVRVVVGLVVLVAVGAAMKWLVRGQYGLFVLVTTAVFFILICLALAIFILLSRPGKL